MSWQPTNVEAVDAVDYALVVVCDFDVGPDDRERLDKHRAVTGSFTAPGHCDIRASDRRDRAYRVDEDDDGQVTR